MSGLLPMTDTPITSMYTDATTDRYPMTINGTKKMNGTMLSLS